MATFRVNQIIHSMTPCKGPESWTFQTTEFYRVLEIEPPASGTDLGRYILKLVETSYSQDDLGRLFRQAVGYIDSNFTASGSQPTSYFPNLSHV